MKIAVVVGTRPEAIKMAPVYFALKAMPSFEPVLLSTGQHREMIDQALSVFGLRPDFDLALMKSNQTLAELTSRVITGVSSWLEANEPKAVLVQGDTTTVLATAQAAFYQRIPIGHVEAGLRTYDFNAPWPEEMNRRLTDPISRWCFAPTEWSAANLRAERIPAAKVHVTGNTVIDALLWIRGRIQKVGIKVEEVAARCSIPLDFARRFLYRPKAQWVLITGHRRESFGAGMENICGAISRLIDSYPDLGVLYPVHLNPNVQGPVMRLLGNKDRVALIPPVSYQDFIWLMERCHFIVSDSGGIQEEAPSLSKPLLVLRDTTERPEGIEAGTCRLVGTNPETILRECDILLNDRAAYETRAALRNPYGDGTAAQKICEIIAADLGT